MFVLEIQLTREQWKFLATLCAGMSQVAMASIVIPFFLDEYSPRLALLGVLVTFILTGLGLIAAKRASL